MNEAEVTRYILDTFSGVHTTEAWGSTFFFYNPDSSLPDEFYFATLSNSDQEGDRASNLDRPGVYRLNIGISKSTYRSLFGADPARRGEDGVVETGHDFSELDRILPHPVYGGISWICVLNPSEATFAAVKPLLAEAYSLVVERYRKRTGQG